MQELADGVKVDRIVERAGASAEKSQEAPAKSLAQQSDGQAE